MLIEDNHTYKTYNLVGDAITQSELANYINQVFDTNLSFNSVSVKEYKKERMEELGDFIGNIIAGIYEGIKLGANDVLSDYEKASGRKHKSTLEIIEDFKG